jgi:hypothetical protein
MTLENKINIIGEGKQLKAYILNLHSININDKKK